MTTIAADSATGSIVIERIERECRPRHDRRADVVLIRKDLRYRLGPDGKPRSVTHVEPHKYLGQTAAGKQFSRWKTVKIESVIRTGSGKTVVFNRSRRRNKHTVNCIPLYGKEGFVSQHLMEKAVELLGPPQSFNELYPLAEGIGMREFTFGNADFLRAWLHVTDVQSLTRNLFGKSRYRKDLVKAVAAADPLGIWIAWQMRDLVPVDWLVDLLRNRARTEPARDVQLPQHLIRDHLRTLDRNSLRRLAKDAGSGLVSMYVRDLGRMAVAPPRRVRSWQELHDHVAPFDRQARQAAYLAATEAMDEMAEQRRKEAEPERAALEGITAGGLRVVAAREPMTLVNWGAQMNTCIGAYTYEMDAGRSHLLGIYDGEKLLANAQVSRGGLRQLLGRSNRELSEAHRDDVVDFLADRGISVDRYWGDGR